MYPTKADYTHSIDLTEGEGRLCTEPELKVEVTCRFECMEQTLEVVKAVHPYEEPVINVIPLYQVGI